MGYMKHHTIVVTSWEERSISAAHAEAARIFDGNAAVPEITPTATNGYRSFFIAPDGSKEGWDESDRGDRARAELIAWLQDAPQYCDWVEIQFGGDDPGLMCMRSDVGAIQSCENAQGELQSAVVKADDV